MYCKVMSCHVMQCSGVAWCGVVCHHTYIYIYIYIYILFILIHSWSLWSLMNGTQSAKLLIVTHLESKASWKPQRRCLLHKGELLLLLSFLCAMELLPSWTCSRRPGLYYHAWSCSTRDPWEKEKEIDMYIYIYVYV